jgi:hypothetical protein
MNEQDIQKILEEQRKQAEIYKKTEKQINIITAIHGIERLKRPGQNTGIKNPMYGKPSPNKGKKFNLGNEWKEKNKKRSQERPGTYQVKTPFGSFPSIEEAASKLCLSRYKLLKNVREDPDQWSITKNDTNYSGRQKVKKPIKTPDGIFRGMNDCKSFYKTHRDHIIKNLKTLPDIWHYISVEEYTVLSQEKN